MCLALHVRTLLAPMANILSRGGSDKPAQGEPHAADTMDDDEDLVIVATFGQVCYQYQHQLSWYLPVQPGPRTKAPGQISLRITSR